MIHLTLFEATELRRDDGSDLHELVAQPRAFALLTYLACAGSRPGVFHRRDTLAGMFWPETDQEQARSNLRRLLRTVRKCVGEETIEGRGDEELRVVASLLSCDVVDFEQSIAEGKLARAVELYRGDFMKGFFLGGTPAPEYEQWLQGRRTELAEKAVEAAWRLATMFEGEENLTAAAQWARRVARLAIRHDDERRFRRALELLIRAGNHVLVLRLYDELCLHLRETVGPRIVVAPETQAIVDRLRH